MLDRTVFFGKKDAQGVDVEVLDISPFSEEMRNIVVCIAFIYQILLMYVKFGLHLRMSEVKLPRHKRIMFTFFLGSLAFFGDFFRLVLADTTSAQTLIPLFASLPGVIITITLWIYFVKSLKFRPVHALEIAVYTYLYFQTITGVTRLVGAVFFAQDPALIDYSKYLGMYIMNFIVSMAFFICMYHILEIKPKLLVVKGLNNETPGKSIALPIFQLSFIYISAACIMIFIPKTIMGSLISLCMLALFSAFSLSLNSNRYAIAEIREKDRQMESLFHSLNQFSAIKHDFYNILQTYNGYFEIGDLEACKRYHQSLVEITTRAGDLLDLSRRAVESPALISLLLNKHERADNLKVSLSIALKCSLSGLPLKDIDICRVIACLLDNAIEAAADSKKKRVSFTIERENNEIQLITITNSTLKPIEVSQIFIPGFTSKKGHQGAGLVNVKSIIENYPNCNLEIRSTDDEVTIVLRMENSVLLSLSH